MVVVEKSRASADGQVQKIGHVQMGKRVNRSPQSAELGRVVDKRRIQLTFKMHHILGFSCWREKEGWRNAEKRNGGEKGKISIHCKTIDKRNGAEMQ